MLLSRWTACLLTKKLGAFLKKQKKSDSLKAGLRVDLPKD